MRTPLLAIGYIATIVGCPALAAQSHETEGQALTAPAPRIKLVERAPDAIDSFYLPQVSTARIDVLSRVSNDGVVTGLFRASINNKQIFERVEVRCKQKEMRWVGDGSSVEEAMRYRNDMSFGAGMQRDIKYPYLQYLCDENVDRH